jgi:hypothetical protein
MKQKSETEEIAKHKEIMKWVDEYFKRSSQTTME